MPENALFVGDMVKLDGGHDKAKNANNFFKNHEADSWPRLKGKTVKVVDSYIGGEFKFADPDYPSYKTWTYSNKFVTLVKRNREFTYSTAIQALATDEKFDEATLKNIRSAIAKGPTDDEIAKIVDDHGWSSSSMSC